jgi:hypothetical protein
MSDRIPTIPATVRYFQHERDVWMFALPHVGDRVMCFFPTTLGEARPLFLVVESIFHSQLRAQYEDPLKPEALCITVSTHLDPDQQQANEMTLSAEGGHHAR